MNELALTIIMSNYNQEQYIEKAIESIISQKVNFKYQLIITDDNSQKDNSIQIIKEYEKKYPDIIKALYNKENGGYLVNILRAKEITKTPYFCLLDADDYYKDDGFLQRAYDFLENNKEYVIYYENVNYLYEDGLEKSFISHKTKSGTYNLNDYFKEIIPIVQTTGQFYRNVIFSKGIPEIMKAAVGTDSERSFEGDYDRFIMHLKYGKAYFNNNICGVYRILPSGIWSRLSESKKLLLNLQTYYDYNRYFENEYNTYFINKMYQVLIDLLQIITDLDTIDFTDKEYLQFDKLYHFITDNKDLVNFKINKRKNKSIIKIIKKIIKIILFIK